MLRGRLGLETARVPHADRHGLMWLSRGRLHAEDGTLQFEAAGDETMGAGAYSIPFQMVTAILLGPGGSVTQDALRLLARHGTGLVAVGEGGVRHYASMPFGPDDSQLARQQARRWADPEQRIKVARRMYAWRLGELVPDADIAVLRGIEGARMRETYRHAAQAAGITWGGRNYDRANPSSNDLPNQALNHVVSAVESCAAIAVAVTGTIPQLGFIHEDSGSAFCLDVTDLYRDSVTVPVAFAAARQVEQNPSLDLERVARQLAGREARQRQIVPHMIDRIKDLFHADDDHRHA